jgi:hypothetical protein
MEPYRELFVGRNEFWVYFLKKGHPFPIGCCRYNDSHGIKFHQIYIFAKINGDGILNSSGTF